MKKTTIIGFLASALLAGSALASRYIAGGYPHGNCANANVAAYISFDELSGDLTIPTGCSAAATVLTAHGSPVYGQPAPAGLGNSISFSGSEYFTTTTDVDALDPGTSDFAVDIWFYTTQTGLQTLANKQNTSGTPTGWSVYMSAGGTPFIRFESVDSTTTDDQDLGCMGITLNDWHEVHVEFQRAAKRAIGTLDGVACTGTTIGSLSSLGNSINSTAPMVLGATTTTAFPLHGRLADFQLTIGNYTNFLSTLRGVRGFEPSYTRGNCTDPNVALWLSMDQQSGDLVVPSGCAAVGTRLVAAGNPGYNLIAPPGLGTAISTKTSSGTTNNLSTAAAVAALDIGTPTTAFSFEGWLKPAGLAQSVFASNCSAANQDCWQIYEHSLNKLGFEVRGHGGGHLGDSFCVAVSGFTDGQWHYVRIAGTPNSFTCAVDGGAPVSNTVGEAFTGTTLVATAPFVLFKGPAAGLSSAPAGAAIADLRLTIGNSTNNLGNALSVVTAANASGRTTSSSRTGIGSISYYTPGNCTDPNVQVYLSLDQASGNLIVPARCSSAGKVLTQHGSPLFSQPAPNGLGNAITFGPSAYYQSSAANSTDGFDVSTSDFTEEMIVKVVTPVSGSAFLAVKGGYATNRPGHQMYTFNNKPGASVADNASHKCAADDSTIANLPTVDNTSFHHIRSAWIASTGTLQLYYDGVFRGQNVCSSMAGQNLTSSRFMWFAAEDGDGDTQTVSIAEYRLTNGNATNSMGFTAVPTSRAAAQ